MRCLPFAVMLFCSSVVHADLFTAQQAFERKEFAKANAELLPLLPLGNAEAAFKLGHMAKAGQGQDKDLIKAYAYFKYADANAFTLAKAEWLELEPSLSAKDKKQANIMLAQLQTQTKVKREDMLKHWATVKAKKSLQAETNKNTPEPLLRYDPKYPVRAAQERLSGFIKFNFFVNKQGDVTAVNILKSYPKGIFEREIIRTAKRWKYKPSPNNWLQTMWFDFSLDAPDADYSSSNFIVTPELIDLAKKGSAQHQYDLANIIESHTHTFFDYNTGGRLRLSYLDPNISADSYTYNPSNFVPPREITPLALRLNVPSELSTNFFVSVDDGGRITEIKFDEQETLSIDIKPFIGHRLTKGSIEEGFYRLERQGGAPRLYPAKRLPSDAYVYWLEQAAKNGHKQAQHDLAYGGSKYSSSNLIITQELIELARKGSSQHQYDLANLFEFHTHTFFDSNTGESRRLSYLDPNLTAVSYTHNPSDFVPPQAITPLALRLNVPKELSTPFFVSVDDGGRITEIKFDDQETLSIDIKPFIGHQLTEGNIKKGFYRVEREGGLPRLYPAKRLPSDAYVYWLEQAAKNGHKEAQHELAFEGSEWETYLLEQKDPLVQTWVGARLVLDGKKAEGQQLLDAAIAQGYQDATLIKADLLSL
jgi:TonB family protein